MMSDSSVKLQEKDMRKKGMPSVSGTKGASSQTSGVYYPPTSCYDYHYPGYSSTYPQSDEKGYINSVGSAYTGIQPDNNSFLYYLPSYGTYTPAYGSEYLQQPCSYGSETFPCYTYDLAYTRNGLTGPAAKPGPARSGVGPSGSRNSDGFTASKTNNSLKSKISDLPFNSATQQPVSHRSRSMYQNPFNEVGSTLQSSGLMRGLNGAGKFSSLANQNPGVFTQYNPISYTSNDKLWNDNNYKYRSKENTGKFVEIKAVTDLTRGPRGENKINFTNLPSEVEQHAFALDRNKYNSKEFQTDYDNAKFYVIKSYSEDDIHKCIKYDVWSSTPNGNKKLHDAFCEADAKVKETGVRCPVFLFFSVNGSGQFVGVAEMTGQVNFSKNMDFWQLDKWNGFFPIKWHVIKDVPNTLLRHITLENNDNRPVTYSRDTQEIGLKQGLEMLSIFKNYTERTCVLDDFEFYENREKALKAKREARLDSQTNGLKNGDHEKEGEKSGEANKTGVSSLVSLTENLSLNNSEQAKSIV
ncbi:evolutionarily conserved C-terminal region 11 [Striga hermonthica]|uniref:YTH domain-containing family protein n=1 Tax=Striga hermonthica TaxID=68872 RepID=A0A9N7R557_STRHE|nr:evolutionarily conserved C-terminal region 11 [Striga hermonthica]